LDFAKQLFSSVYFNAGWQGDYMLLAHDVAEKDLKWFRERGILIKHCLPLAEKIAGRWPTVVLSKLYLFESELKKWDQIIYFDADVVVNGSLDNLLNTNKIACLSNLSRPFFRQVKLKHILRSHNLSQKEFSQIDVNLPMFTSCLFVVDTKIITTKTFDDLKLLLVKYQDIIGGTDEFILSLYFARQWRGLSPIYCLYFNFLKQYGVSFKGIGAVTSHFISYQKPMDYCDSIYEIWKKNLSRADGIDLNNRLPAHKIWGDKEVSRFHWRLKRRVIVIWARFYLQRLIGVLGAFINKMLPSLYKYAHKFKKTPRPVFTLRQYRSGDEIGIIRVFNTVFSNNEMTIEKWRWKYLACPEPPKIIVAINAFGEIVGHIGSLANIGKSSEKERTVRQNVDICLLPEYRNQNFLKRGLEIFMKEPDFLAWGFSGRKKLIMIYKKITGAINHNNFGVILKIKIFRKKVPLKILMSSQRIETSPYSIKEIINGDMAQEIDKFWMIKSQEIHIAICRNWKYLKWRIIDSPENQRLFVLKFKGKLIGYFSMKSKDFVIYIKDILILNRAVNYDVFNMIECYCQGLGAKQIVIMASDQHIKAILKKQKYRPVKNAFFGCYDFYNKTSISNIYLTFNDADWQFDV